MYLQNTEQFILIYVHVFLALNMDRQINNMLRNMRRINLVYQESFKCYPPVFADITQQKREKIENGGKILMPPSSLERLLRFNSGSPMMFKASKGVDSPKCTHCGVLEFTADEGEVLFPEWMMDNLGVEYGDEITLRNVTLPIGSYVKFQPENDSFLKIDDQKAVLETALRDFSCLTKGDKVAVFYNDVQYNLFVKELKPADAVNIVECDLHLDIEAPEGYKE